MLLKTLNLSCNKICITQQHLTPLGAWQTLLINHSPFPLQPMGSFLLMQAIR